MSIQIIPKSRQGAGAFNGGEIIENKPIGFPQDHSSVSPYSNLFYWAHARAVTDSTIGLHPHKGFEICSFVLKGEIRHFDTKLKEWRTLEAGDVQIIRAGNGISHSEFMAKDGEMFQIWFDPNLEATLGKPASYDDYRASSFPATQTEGVRMTTLVGEGSPFQMDTPGIRVWRIELAAGSHYALPADPKKVYSSYVLDGVLNLNGTEAVLSDYAIARDLSALELVTAAQPATIFIIESLAAVGYPTYGQMMRRG
ncbi:MAG: pirin family protein [Lewinellaceae bacterium]|nr:pirin family protein [Lewinellaceae bacterium]